MGLQYKIDILEALREKGYSSYRLRQEGILGQRTIQQLRHGLPISWDSLEKICNILNCDISEILAYEES